MKERDDAEGSFYIILAVYDELHHLREFISDEHAFLIGPAALVKPIRHKAVL